MNYRCHIEKTFSIGKCLVISCVGDIVTEELAYVETRRAQIFRPSRRSLLLLATGRHIVPLWYVGAGTFNVSEYTFFFICSSKRTVRVLSFDGIVCASTIRLVSTDIGWWSSLFKFSPLTFRFLFVVADKKMKSRLSNGVSVSFVKCAIEDVTFLNLRSRWLWNPADFNLSLIIFLRRSRSPTSIQLTYYGLHGTA